MTSAYHKFPCEICGRDISDAGFARDGLLGWQIDYEPTDADLRDRAADWKMDDDRMARD
ncbi:MAG: hypothetical protein ABI119_03290 [Gemmatimonadaceae bacterium]